MGIFLLQRAKYLASILFLVTSYNPNPMQLAANQADNSSQQYSNYKQAEKTTSFQVANTPSKVYLPPISKELITTKRSLIDLSNLARPIRT